MAMFVSRCTLGYEFVPWRAGYSDEARKLESSYLQHMQKCSLPGVVKTQEKKFGMLVEQSKAR